MLWGLQHNQKHYTLGFKKLLLIGLFGCFLGKQNDPMCDAMCDEQYTHNFSKPLNSYSLKASFRTEQGELDSIEVYFNGTSVSGYSSMQEVSIRADAESIRISSIYGNPIGGFVFEINSTELSPSLVEETKNELCGSVCTKNSYTLNTNGPQFLDCEDCAPYAMLYVENFWFRSEQNNYAKVVLINHLQSDILFNYGG